jgi:hypothetical protein
MGVAAFWIALAAVIVAGYWRGKMKDQMRHETVRLLIEKGEPVGQEQLRELLNPAPPPLPPNHPWVRPKLSGFKQFRIVGTLLMIAAPGLAAMIAGISYSQGEPQPLPAALGIAAFAFLVGIGLFLASRFVAPPEEPEHDSTRVA